MGITVRINIKRGEEIERVRFKEEEEKKKAHYVREESRREREEDNGWKLICNAEAKAFETEDEKYTGIV